MFHVCRHFSLLVLVALAIGWDFGLSDRYSDQVERPSSDQAAEWAAALGTYKFPKACRELGLSICGTADEVGDDLRCGLHDLGRDEGLAPPAAAGSRQP